MKIFLFLIRILLIPLSLVYSFIIYLRNKLYNAGTLKTVKINVPVISIGNITTGGTGKTPFTIFTARYFLEKGYSVGIISRGYKRKTEGMVIVCDGKDINFSAEETGDELAMTAGALSDHKDKLYIAASSDRVQAAEYISEKFNPDVLILDDGFQHRRLHRDLDIVIADAVSMLNNKFLNSFTLPSGMLREFSGNMKRADLIIQNNKHLRLEALPALEKIKNDLIVIRYKTEYLIDFKNIILNTDANSKEAIIFSGLADDKSFIEMIKVLNINIAGNIKYKDHHKYSEEDINLLKSKFSDNKIFITTEKDFIKVRNFKSFINEYPVFYLKIGIEIVKNAPLLFNNYDKLVK